MKKGILVVIIFFCLNNISFSQEEFTIQNSKESTKIKFKLINNLIVFPVEINGVTLSFLLDTGVSKPIIFNFLNVSDSLKIKNTESFFLRGLGEGESVEALKSTGNVLKIGEAIKPNQDMYAVYDANLNFTPLLGVPIHGIIGYDLFKGLTVEINYSNKFIKLTKPHIYKYKECSKCKQFNLEFHNKKPYVRAQVKVDDKNIPVKLLIDSGSSDALWLFENDDLGLKSSDKYFYDFLGHGLGGSLFGKRSRIEAFSLKDFMLNNVNVAFPDSTYTLYARKIKNRNGSLGGNILKRFNIIMDYKKAIITLKRNNHFKDKFRYNKSGIELAHEGFRFVKEMVSSTNNTKSALNNDDSNGVKVIINPQYKISLKPAYTIIQLRENSPAKKAGLKEGDIVLRINSTSTHQSSLQDLIEMFYGNDGKIIRLKVDRDGEILNFVFRLENPF